MKRTVPDRVTASNFEGAPCPRCTAPLAYRADLPEAEPGTVLILLECPAGHCWQERMTLSSGHSGVFVERRADLETPAGDTPGEVDEPVLARRPGVILD